MSSGLPEGLETRIANLERRLGDFNSVDFVNFYDQMEERRRQELRTSKRLKDVEEQLAVIAGRVGAGLYSARRPSQEDDGERTR